jgi:phosphate transport system protein
MTALTRSMERMGKLVQSRLKVVLDAYTPRTSTAPRRLGRDDEVDEHYNSLFRELLTYMMGDPRTINGLRPPAVRGQEPRTHRRPRHQHRRDHPFEMTGEEMLSPIRPKLDALA